LPVWTFYRPVANTDIPHTRTQVTGFTRRLIAVLRLIVYLRCHAFTVVVSQPTVDCCYLAALRRVTVTLPPATRYRHLPGCGLPAHFVWIHVPTCAVRRSDCSCVTTDVLLRCVRPLPYAVPVALLRSFTRLHLQPFVTTTVPLRLTTAVTDYTVTGLHLLPDCPLPVPFLLLLRLLRYVPAARYLRSADFAVTVTPITRS